MSTLDEVAPDRAFWFCNGTRAASLQELADGIEQSHEGVFAFHTDGREDFANWVRDSVGDEGLGRLLDHERDRYWFLQKLRTHITFLRNHDE